MKLLINKELTYTDSDNIDAICTILQMFNVKYNIEYEQGNKTLIICGGQKVVLNEIDMNTLFFEALMFWPANVLNLQYSPLGGVGCDFTIKIV